MLTTPNKGFAWNKRKKNIVKCTSTNNVDIYLLFRREKNIFFLRSQTTPNSHQEESNMGP
jgi:hypothetical protein